MIKHPKRKGNRREYQARDQLHDDGYAVVRAGGSLGIWDLVAIRRDPEPDAYLPVVRLVQVKSNAWPRPAERQALADDAERYSRIFVRCEIWRYDDGCRQPKAVILNGE